jgi:hypothetical protein
VYLRRTHNHTTFYTRAPYSGAFSSLPFPRLILFLPSMLYSQPFGTAPQMQRDFLPCTYEAGRHTDPNLPASRRPRRRPRRGNCHRRRCLGFSAHVLTLTPLVCRTGPPSLPAPARSSRRCVSKILESEWEKMPRERDMEQDGRPS